MKQRFPRGTRPVVGVAALMFAGSALAALRHVARHWPDLYARLAVIEVTVTPDAERRERALQLLRKQGPIATSAIAARGREQGLPDDLFVVFAQHAGTAEIDLLAQSVVGAEEPRRRAAVEALGRLKTAEAALAAAPAVTDPSPAVRSAARNALRGQDPETLTAMITIALGSTSAIPENLAALLVEEGIVGSAIGPVSQAIASSEPIRLWNGLHLALLLFRDHPPGQAYERPLIEALAAAFPRCDGAGQAVALEILTSLSDPGRLGVLETVALARRYPPELRGKAIRAIGATPHPEAVRILESMVRSGPSGYRFLAADVLGTIGTPQDAARWIDLVERGVPEPESREGLIRSIGACGGPDLLPRLLALIRASDSPGLAAALRMISTRSPKPAAAALIDGIEGAAPAYLGLMNTILTDITWHRAAWTGTARTAAEFDRERLACLEDWRAWWKDHGGKTEAEWRAAGLAEAEEDLRSRTSNVRFQAILRLVRLAPADLDLRLAALVNDPDDVVWGRAWTDLSTRVSQGSLGILREELARGTDRAAVRAARALGYARDRESAETLALALSRKDPDARTAAAAALGNLALPESSAVLLASLRDSEINVRIAARDALEAIADRSIEPELLRGLADPNQEHRASCAWLLGSCGSTAAVRPLAALFEDPNELVARASLRSVQMLTGRMPSLRPTESDLARWEDLVRRRRTP